MDIKSLMDCMTHPVKNRILLAVRNKGECTAKELLSALPDIPQATLYRSLRSMIESGILLVVAENKVRALTEKVYAVDERVFAAGNAALAQNDGAAYFRLFSAFVMELLEVFRSYGEKPGINILQDGSGFSATPLYATAQELAEIGQKIKEIVVPYQLPNPETEGQVLHNFATIITPPIE